ncbi:hypothetical protein [Candidatus Lokiarchaeum ossiferum]|uniref:hypothetical protein n=1 Tax=Candidatus Lokiarchaeum ossiferum TaxID=2951803 RepID=UPI00352BF370
MRSLLSPSQKLNFLNMLFVLLELFFFLLELFLVYLAFDLFTVKYYTESWKLIGVLAAIFIVFIILLAFFFQDAGESTGNVYLAMNQESSSSFCHHRKRQPSKPNRKKNQKGSENANKGSESKNREIIPSIPTLQEIDYIIKNCQQYRPRWYSIKNWETQIKFDAALHLIHTYLSEKSCSFQVFGEHFFLEAGRLFYSNLRKPIWSHEEIKKLNLTSAHFYRKIRKMVSEIEDFAGTI